MPDPVRLRLAYERARDALWASREPSGHWIGELATSALSTATAVSSLSLLRQNSQGEDSDVLLVRRGVEWLLQHQNADGGWGDTDKSYSNIATTMLCMAAFKLSRQHIDSPERMDEPTRLARQYVDQIGGIPALRRRYGVDKTFAVPILTNCALAGIVPWSEVSPLPFELACFPQGMYRFLGLPVVSYAIPALVAIGQVRHHLAPSRNPLVRFIRNRAVEPSLRVLAAMQPASGGYLEAVPLSSFVVMSLAASQRGSHSVAVNGARFIRESVRPDGSWPIDTNLATWNTTLAVNALASGGEDLMKEVCLDWILSCQNRVRHPFTGAAPGGWGWSDLSGAVPDADDTPSALLALNHWRNAITATQGNSAKKILERIDEAAEAGIEWLLGLQNSDGGWPTFCRGWGKLPFDRSGADLTAHVLRAFHVWEPRLNKPELRLQVTRARSRGLGYLDRCQREDGSWVPLWFGNQDHPQEENPIYGTAKVLMAYRDMGLIETSVAKRGLTWLRLNQSVDGGWGASSSVEETALAVEALMASPVDANSREANAGLDWLIRAVETNRYLEPSPIGFYFAKLWYYERLYPVIFTVSALASRALTTKLADADQPAHARLS